MEKISREEAKKILEAALGPKKEPPKGRLFELSASEERALVEALSESKMGADRK